MENFTVLQTPKQLKDCPSEKVTATGINHIQNEGIGIIIGLESIDRIMIELCPEIGTMSGEDINILSSIVTAYWFERKDVLNVIRQITNRETTDFIEGISLLINEAEMKDLATLQDYFDACTEDFNPEFVCSVEEIKN